MGGCEQTCLRIHRKIVLALNDGVHQPGAVSICWIISVSGCDLDYGRACERTKATEVISQMAFSQQLSWWFVSLK